MTAARACVFGCAGAALDEEERAFFHDVRPWGFILFARNVVSLDQIQRLTADLRAAVDDADALVFVDQEGGRVQRLRPPLARLRQSAAAFGALWADDPATALEAVALNHRLLAHELRAAGLNADCAPCLDVLQPRTHAVIGDRAFSADPTAVAALGRAAVEGLMRGGVAPVLKHIPGHGAAGVDSHETLPTVDKPLEELNQFDFAPFRALRDAPIAMTAHVAYTAVDAHNAATLSAGVIETAIRGSIGFDGLLLSDDLSMRALTGSLCARAAAAIAAGCDVTLHGNGALVGEPVRDLMAELREVARGTPELAGAALARADRARACAGQVKPFDAAAAEARLAALGVGSRAA